MLLTVGNLLWEPPSFPTVKGNATAILDLPFLLALKVEPCTWKIVTPKLSAAQSSGRAGVHDELILTAPAEIAEQTLKLAHRAMSDAFAELFPNVPIEVEGKVCQHWGEKA